MADPTDHSTTDIPGMGKLVSALKFLAEDPKLLALVMIVLTVAFVVLGVVARPSEQRNDFMIALFALFIILVIGGVVSIAFLGFETRKSTETTKKHIGRRGAAYVNSTLLARERPQTPNKRTSPKLGEDLETESPGTDASKNVDRPRR
jgi:hypothetical protein